MATDQEQADLKAGWAFGKNSIKAHYFKTDHITSVCGKATQTIGAQRNARIPYPSDCAACQHGYTTAEKRYE